MEQYTLFIDIETKIKRSIHAMQTFEAKALQMSRKGTIYASAEERTARLSMRLQRWPG